MSASRSARPSAGRKKATQPSSASTATQQVLSKYFTVATPASAPSVAADAGDAGQGGHGAAEPHSRRRAASGRRGTTAAVRQEETVSEDEIDAVMETGEGQSAQLRADDCDVFAAFAHAASASSAQSASAASRQQLSHLRQKQTSEQAEGDTVRKRRRLRAMAGDDEVDERPALSSATVNGSRQQEAKEESEAEPQAEVEAMETEAAVADRGDDEDLPLRQLRSQGKNRQQLQDEKEEKRASSPASALEFPSRFVSDAAVHSRNVRRFLEQEQNSDAAETEVSSGSSNDAFTAESGRRAASSSPSPVDLTDDTAAVRVSSSASSSASKSRGGKVKYTPLETQVLEIQRRHPELVIFFEVGYKFRFFGRDAEIAARHLDIIAHPSHHLLTASIPTFRLLVHMRRLVEAGYKVGVVRQTETAAQKRLDGGSGSGAFSRKLTEVYTKATFLNEVVAEEKEEAGQGETASRFILVMYEEPASSNFTPASASSPFFDSAAVVVHLVALDPISGSVVYDEFSDGFMRQELETRLLQLAPEELLLPDSGRAVSKNSWKLLQAWRETRDAVRLERLDSSKFPFDYAKATAVITDYYSSASSASSCASSPPSPSAASLSSSLDFALSLPKGPLICLSVLIPYLAAFHLTSAFLLSSNFRPFLSSGLHMLVGNNTLINLDILSSSHSDRKKGSLLWLLQHTKTAFGSRLLRHWVQRPLLSQAAIEARLDAVTELMDARQAWVSQLASLLSTLPDLERGLSRIHYSTCKPHEFVLLLHAYERIVSTLPEPEAVSSARLRQLLSSVDRVAMRDVLSFFLGSLDAAAVEADAKSSFYTDASLFPAIAERKEAIHRAEQHMRSLLLSIRKQLGAGYGSLEYKSVLTSRFLIEVNVADTRRAPAGWMRVNSTKQKVRYHTPELVQGWMQLTRAEELLAEESERCWRSFLQRFADHYALCRQVISALAELDCLLSFAAVSLSAGYCRPQFVSEERTLDVRGLRHPTSELLIASSFVPNDLQMTEGGRRLMLITGPNLGGKSTYIRAAGLVVIMAQLGVYVPASSCRLSVFDAVYSRMGARDSLHSGHSTFMVELAETRNIVSSASSRSLLIFDELGRGTATDDGVAIAYAVMHRIIRQLQAFTLLVTHYPQLAQLTTAFPSTVAVYHMGFLSESRRTAQMQQDGKEAVQAQAADDAAAVQSVEPDADVVFLYSLVEGAAPRSFGLNVARLAHVSEDIVQRAGEIAVEMGGGSGDTAQQQHDAEDINTMHEELDALLSEL